MEEKIVRCETQNDYDNVVKLHSDGFIEQKATVTNGIIVYQLVKYTDEEKAAQVKSAEAALLLQTAVPDKFKNIDGLISIDLIKEPTKCDELLKKDYKLLEAWKDRASLVHEKEVNKA